MTVNEEYAAALAAAEIAKARVESDFIAAKAAVSANPDDAEAHAAYVALGEQLDAIRTEERKHVTAPIITTTDESPEG